MWFLKVFIFLTWYFIFLHLAQGGCQFEDTEISKGDKVFDMCHECTCVLATKNHSQYCFKCENSPCLTDPAIIETVNKGSHSWKAGVYLEFLEMTVEDARRNKLGTFSPNHAVEQLFPMEENITENGLVTLSYDERNASIPSVLVTNKESLPNEFDARTKWPNLIHPPQDQEHCGASWAFSSAGVASDRLAIETNGSHKISLSPNALFDAQDDKNGCNGGHLDRAWKYMETKGTISERCFEYYFSNQTSPAPQCWNSNITDCPCLYNIIYMTRAYMISNNEADIMVEIMNNGPVQTLMKINKDFFLYKSGIYRYSTYGDSDQSAFIGYHSVRIIGWGEEILENDESLKYWVCVNSWGEHWGEEGYFRIEQGQLEFIVASHFRCVQTINPIKPKTSTHDVHQALAKKGDQQLQKKPAKGRKKGKRKMPNTYKLEQTLEHTFEIKNCRDIKAGMENQAANVLSSRVFVFILLFVFLTLTSYG